MSNIEVVNESSGTEIEETNGRSFSFQEYQSIYSDLTKKTEKLEKKYQKTYKLDKSHISHLKEMIHDNFSQYNVISINTNVIVYQEDKVKKTYSSIENFLIVETLQKAIESIIIEYNVLLNAPNIEKKQNYTIRIELVSDLVAFEKIRNEIPIEFAEFFEKNNISVKIDYVDYTVAKSMVNALDEWIEDISERDSRFITLLSKYKNVFSLIIKFMILIITIYLVYNQVPNYISSEIADMQILVKFLIIGAVIFYFTDKISIITSRLIKNNLSFLQNYSAIVLTAEDKKNYTEYKKNTKVRIVSFFITVAMTITYGVVSTFVAEWLKT